MLEKPVDEELELALEYVGEKLLEKLLEWLDVWAADDDEKGVECEDLDDGLEEEVKGERLHPDPPSLQV